MSVTHTFLWILGVADLHPHPSLIWVLLASISGGLGVHCVWLTSPEQEEEAEEEAEGEAETEETNVEGKALSGVRVQGSCSWSGVGAAGAPRGTPMVVRNPPRTCFPNCATGRPAWAGI